MAEVKMTVLNNGPLKVTGAVELQWADGTPVPLEKDTVFLCRCGASTTKPFCDGAHSRIGFAAAREEVPQSAE